MEITKKAEISMKRIKNAVSIILAVLMMFSIFIILPSTVSAESYVTSGITGDCTWNYYSSTGELRIYGKGKMGDFFNGDLSYYSIQSKIKTVVVGNGVTSICSGAFCNCYTLKSVTIGNSVTSIGSSAFKSCTGLTSITIGNSVTSIGSEAFWNCYQLTSVAIPNSVTSIGNSAFGNCSNLKNIYYSGDECDWKKIIIGSFNDDLLKAIIHYNGYDDGTTSGNIAEPTAEPTEPTAEPTEPTAEPTELTEPTYENTPYTTYTIMYNANGGNGVPKDQIKKAGDTINLSVIVPTRKYHTFVGWTEHLCSDKYYQPGSAFTEDRNITLFAVWGMDCYYCNGKGKTNEEVTCKYCKGKGSVNATVKCINCEGSGEIIANVVHFGCEVCNGTGFYGGNNCFRCKGLGYYTQRELATCPKCSGTGKVNESRECRYCWGDGYRFEDIICTECEGKGKIIEKADHKCEWVVTKPATKTQTGIKENRCVVCGAVVESKIIPKITKFILGDVDSDGDVSIIDATCIQRHLAELATVSYNEIAADADGDGEVTILDATGIQRYLAELPCFAGIGNPIS